MAIAAPMRFPPVRIGQFTPEDLYVLGRASEYPVGSVTQVPRGLKLPNQRTARSGRFYLEHTANGFWQVTWPDDGPHDYRACGPVYDTVHRRFTCPNGAIWNLEGSAANNPDPRTHADAPLQRQQVTVSDDYVLVLLPPAP